MVINKFECTVQGYVRLAMEVPPTYLFCDEGPI